MLRKRKFIYCSMLLLSLLLALPGLAQRHDYTKITGYVQDQDGKALPGASVYLKNTSYGAKTDDNGHYVLIASPGDYLLVSSVVGFTSKETKIVLKPRETQHQRIRLQESGTSIDEVTVSGKSALKEAKETAYNVAVLDATKFHNSSMELSDLLNRASGVKIRQDGGLGSRASINLNGFTGRHVKVFIDGIPMQGMGSAFQLNNIPVNIAERIEIYKGVVPIELGSDALGGAINIITNKRNKSYADVSYSYGSFNTHKTNVNVGYSAKNGFTVQLNAFQNYSDNDYPVYTQIRDFETSIFTPDSVWTKAFHNKYHNETAAIKAGFVNTKWADQFLVGVTVGQEYAAIQNANIMKIVYGEKARKGNTVMPSLTYSKRDLFIDGLDVRLMANYNHNYNQNIDTATREYNWLGEFRQRKTIGEGASTMAEFNNNNASASLNVVYDINNRHSLAVNDVWTTYIRKNADQNVIKDEFSKPEDKASNYKNILGLSYKFNYNKQWVTTVFGKHYKQSTTGTVNVGESESFPTWERITADAGAFGYGIATTYFWKALQYKLSYEKALRMPSETEILGDAVLERANAALRPEKSNGINIGVSYQEDFNENHAIYIDASGLYRDVQDFIQRTVVQRTGEAQSVNHGQVQNLGLNFEGRYYYKRFLSAGGTLTYQSLINKEKYTNYGDGQLSATYNDRMPNQPYFYGNGEVEVRFQDLGAPTNLLTVGYNLNYVHEFYLNWPSLGTSSEKRTIDRQFSHDIVTSYAMKGGRYNVTFEARNITDQRLYDNFSLQKPGRSFSVKLRYFFM
ncbi:TonB-dependent receptor [Sphingobacterium sp. DN00404]|uniref:TonB-dependent receptor n=1 Tax=Sphingobacterium micropteri TaxID=2763501 RepID=A0ABR7YTD1_9SPHI|nr:TonB-dependent receptor [Sphingobacterium micropteri]MBD1434594.1 TonB-dependent receptor [Sphingobacterium micropteri]